MVGVQRPSHGKKTGAKAISQHSSQTACEAGVRWTAESSPRLRARSKRCATARGPAIRVNKRLCSPRALHLPHLYQGAPLPVGSIATAAGLSEPPVTHRDHLAGARTPTPTTGDAGAVARSSPLNCASPCGVTGALESASVLSPAQKVEHLFRIFDVDQDALLCYSELRAFLSALAEKEWDDRLRFEEWCMLLKVDSSHGLTSHAFGRLLSLERSFLDDSFRILGLESLGAKVLSPAPVLRMELLRRALNSNLALAPLLASFWRSDFQRLLASELLSGVSGSGCAGSATAGNRGMSPAHMALSGSDSQDVFSKLLSALHELVEAAAGAAERWYGCFQGYLRRAALDQSVEEWAAFDATWGAKIATLMAQVRAVESLQQEVTETADDARPELVWRYARAVLDFLPILELSKPNGLVMPMAQIAALESAARRVQAGCPQSRTPNVEAAVQPSHSPPRSPSQRKQYRRPFARPVRGWAGRPVKSAPATPVDRPLKPVSAASPVDWPSKSVPATPVQQAPVRQDGSQHKIQPPEKLSGRTGKRPLATRPAQAASTVSDGQAADSDAQVTEAHAAAAVDVDADDLAVQADELEAVLDGADATGSEARQEVEDADAGADAVYDNDSYEDDEDEAGQQECFSDHSSADLRQHARSTFEPVQSTCSHDDESRDVVEPLPAERCESSARESAIAGNTDSLRSGTPASTATYEMDFDSEDGNAAVDVRSDEGPTAAADVCSDDGAAAPECGAVASEEQEDRRSKDAGVASESGSSPTLEENKVDAAAQLKESIAAEMQSNAVLAAEMHGFSKDVQLARKPLRDDDDVSDDDEDDFLEDARRAAHRHEAEEVPEVQLARKPFGDHDDDEEDDEQNFFEDTRQSARREEPQAAASHAGQEIEPEVLLNTDASRAELQVDEKVDNKVDADQQPLLETHAIDEAEQGVWDAAMGAIAKLEIADNLDNAEDVMLSNSLDALDADAAASEGSHVCEAAAAAIEGVAATDALREGPLCAPVHDEQAVVVRGLLQAIYTGVEPERAPADGGSQRAAVRCLLQAIYTAVEPELPPADASTRAVRSEASLEGAGAELESASAVAVSQALRCEGSSEGELVERQSLPETGPAAEELQADQQAAIADDSSSTSSESSVECFTTEIPSRQVSPAVDQDMVQQVQHRYLVDNSALCADADGISYRIAKDLAARVEPEDVALWNSHVYGFDDGGEWIRVPAKNAFLPLFVNGIRVLTECNEANEKRKGSRRSSAGGSSVWELDIDANLQTFDPDLSFLHSSGADGSLPRFAMVYEAGEVSSLPPNRDSLGSAVAETISLPPESASSMVEHDSNGSMAESRNSSDEFSAELLQEALP